MKELPSRDDFAAQLNTSFHLSFGDAGTADAELVEVSELSRRPRQESFSLLFLAPGDPPALQQLVAVEHPQLGSFELFVVPVGQRPEGIEYEAVFSRLTD